MLFKYLIFLFVLTKCANSSKILAIIWTDSKSHHIATVPLLQALAKKGHDVHLLSSFNDQVEIPTYKQELLTGILGKGRAPLIKRSFIGGFLDFIESRKKTADLFWKNEAVQKIVKEKPKYDAVICFPFFSDHTYALAHHVEAPLIIFSSGSSSVVTNKLVGNPNLPYNTHFFTDRSVDTFLGRLMFATFNILLAGVENYLMLPFHEEIKSKYLPEAPKIAEIHKNISLIFINSHFSMEQPRPYVPNMIQIGGYSTEKVKELPEKLQRFLDSATKGAAIFSMGTNIKIGINIGNKTEILMKTFSKLAPIKILFKSEIEIPYAPENVMIVDWLPQNDVLAHPNVKLFISHGGLGGITEAITHGVPMLGIPFYGDQSGNIALAIESGFALEVDINNLNQEILRETLEELLSNPKYAKNARKRSSLFKNRPVKPMDNAIWWVEHIIEHKGGEHLRNMGVNLEWYQLYMVDIVLFYLVLIVIATIISFCTTKWIVKKIYKKLVGCNKKKTKKIKKQ